MGEKILVVPASVVRDSKLPEGYTGDFGKPVYDILKPENLSFVDRDGIEENPEWKQIIPYMVLIGACKECLPTYVYTRGKTGDEGRLHDLLSIGIGGHVSEEDVKPLLWHPKSKVRGGDENDIVLRGATRELFEELEIGTTIRMAQIGWLNDNSNPVGQVHLGVVYAVEMAEMCARPIEDSIAKGGFMPLQNSFEKLEQFEPWSRLLIEYMREMAIYRHYAGSAFAGTRTLL